MTRPFAPSRLFEAAPRPSKRALYPSFRAALDAVQRGAKAMETNDYMLSQIATGHPRFAEDVRDTLDRGLAFVLSEEPRSGETARTPDDRRGIGAYAVPLDQTWRILALRALRDSIFRPTGRWTRAADEQQSALLGYTPAQRRAFQARRAHQEVAYGCLTMFTLLTPEQRASCLAYGKRCFGSANELVGRTFFFMRGRFRLREDAYTRVPRGRTLARVGLESSRWQRLFGDRRDVVERGLVTGTVTSANAQVVVDHCVTNVELLTRRGWA